MPSSKTEVSISVSETDWDNQIQSAIGAANKMAGDEPFSAVGALLRMSGIAQLAAGKILTKLRQQFTAKECSHLMARAHISRRTADRLIKLWQRYKQLPAATGLMHLGSTKLHVLASLSDEEIEQLAKGQQVRNIIDIDFIERVTAKQLELDLSESQSATAAVAAGWKRRYEHTARRLREEQKANKKLDKSEEYCARALANIRRGVEQLIKIAQKLEGTDQAYVIAPAVKEAAYLCQYKLGRVKNQIVKAASNGHRRNYGRTPRI